VEKWLEDDFTPEPVKLLLLLDPRFFNLAQTRVVSGASAQELRVTEMPIEAKKIRELRKTGWPSTESAVEGISLRASLARSEQAPPEWVFGESTFRIVTKPGVSGPTTIGLSVWYRDRPVDEIVYSTCVLPAGAVGICTPSLETTSLTGVDSLRVLASDGNSPDAAVHFIELGDKIKGVVHVKETQSDEFADWTVNMDRTQFREKLTKYLKLMGTATSESSLGGTAKQFFNFLFPEKDADKENVARRELLNFMSPALLGDPFQENAKSIFIRMIQQGNLPPLVIPFGLLALETQDPKIPGKRQTKFLGSYFRIEAPLEYQDYQQPKQCIERWVTVLPPEDTGDDTLNAAKKEIETTLRLWSKKEESMSSMKAFATWNSEKEMVQNKSGAALVVLSHHDADQLFFYKLTSDKDFALMPEAITRVMPYPSVAILNGCGTAAPDGSDMLRHFNQNGFMAIIATSTEVNGHMAGAFLKLLAQELETTKTESVTVSRAYFRTVKHLSQLRPPSDPKKSGSGIGEGPYGALALKYALLGNGALTFCPQRGGGP
jgi:hypothetical protein